MSPKKRLAPRVEDLRPHELSMVLTRLAQRTDAVGEAVREEIERLVVSVDVEAVAAEVEVDLELIDEDEIGARSGSDRYGYTVPYEAVWEVLEETLQPHVDRLAWFFEAGRHEACDAYALGVFRGLYDFHHTGDATWKELAPDDLRELFAWVLRAWQERRTGAAERQAMRDHLATWCAGWEGDVDV
jgi:hypothetical protein